MTCEEDIQFMRMAIEAAREGRRTPGGECVGAALVREGEAACITFKRARCNTIPLPTLKLWQSAGSAQS